MVFNNEKNIKKNHSPIFCRYLIFSLQNGMVDEATSKLSAEVASVFKVEMRMCPEFSEVCSDKIGRHNEI